MKARGLTLCAVVLLGAATARADVESGPKAGEKVSTLKVYGVVGTVEGKEADFTAERKGALTVYVFVQAEHFGRPTARFLKTLDGDIAKNVDSAAVIVVWVGEKTSFDKH
jgi:hypothetical protein